jgi:HEAT repeat protein
MASLGTARAQTDAENAWAILKAAVVATNLEDRTAATRVLGLIENDATARDLALAALDDPKPEVRAAGADALGNMKAKDAKGRLRDIIKSDQEITVVVSAAHALVLLGDDEGYEVYYAILTGEMKSGKSLLEQQKKMLHDPKKLAEFGFEQGIGFVPFAGMGWTAYKLISKDDVSPVRAAAAKVLTNDPDPKSEQALIGVLTDKSWVVRMAALDALAHRGNATIIPQIDPVLSDEKPAVRYMAAATIIRLSKPGGSGKPVRRRRTPEAKTP